jgi:hypothetical protein
MFFFNISYQGNELVTDGLMVSISQIGRVGSSTDMALVVSQIEMAMIRMERSLSSVRIDPDIIVGITMMSLWGVGTNSVSSVAASCGLSPSPLPLAIKDFL